MRMQKATRFALHAALELARAGGERVTNQAIAERYGISVNHLAKVMGQLVRARIARAARGVGGGYLLARDPAEVSLLQIIEAIEGPRPQGCTVAEVEGAPCPVPCGMRPVFEELAAVVDERLARVTLADALGRQPGRRRKGPPLPRR